MAKELAYGRVGIEVPLIDSFFLSIYLVIHNINLFGV
jgi:hypothetical protein